MRRRELLAGLVSFPLQSYGDTPLHVVGLEQQDVSSVIAHLATRYVFPVRRGYVAQKPLVKTEFVSGVACLDANYLLSQFRLWNAVIVTDKPIFSYKNQQKGVYSGVAIPKYSAAIITDYWRKNPGYNKEELLGGLAIHEVAHFFGAENCGKDRCLMNGDPGRVTNPKPNDPFCKDHQRQLRPYLRTIY